MFYKILIKSKYVFLLNIIKHKSPAPRSTQADAHIKSRSCILHYYSYTSEIYTINLYHKLVAREIKHKLSYSFKYYKNYFIIFRSFLY